MFVFVATDASNQVVGTVAYTVLKREEGHPRGMAVLPSWQGAGVAKNLLQHAELRLAQAYCKRIRHYTTQPLKHAIQFYLRNGYLPSGKVTDFFGTPLFEYVKILRR
jgi:GNAT superfamily N-acetyltransferase